MGKFTVGDVIVVVFPFSDLKGQKLRPALILAQAEFENLILCQITSKSYASNAAIPLTRTDFAHGGLPIDSFIRPDKLFTADVSIVEKSAGSLTQAKRNEVLSTVQSLFAEHKT